MVYITSNVVLLQMDGNWGTLTASSDDVSTDSDVAQCAVWLWCGHMHWSRGSIPSAIHAYSRAGILGAPSLACCYLVTCDVGAALSLALRVAEICFAEGFQTLKRFDRVVLRFLYSKRFNSLVCCCCLCAVAVTVGH